MSTIPETPVRSSFYTEAFCEGCNKTLHAVPYNLTRSEWDMEADMRKAVINGSLQNHKCPKNPHHVIISVRFAQRHEANETRTHGDGRVKPHFPLGSEPNHGAIE